MNIDYFIYIGYLLRIIIFFLLLTSLGIWIYLAKNNKSKRNYTISPIFFLLHAILFSILSFFNLISREVYIFWRDLVFIHALIIFFTTGIMFIKMTGGKNNG